MIKLIGDLRPEEFENLIYDLVQALGLKNAVWRTPGRDGGRDIQGEWYVKDLSGHLARQVWYVECKRYESSVNWPTVWEKISYAESNAADVLLFAVTSSLSPQAVDEANKWNAQRKSPIVRYWGGVDIEKKLQLFPAIAIKYCLSPDPRIVVGGALLPVVNILLKYSIAAHSAEVFETESKEKHAVVYSLSELISARLSEVELEGAFSVAPFRESMDTFDWLQNAVYLEQIRIDRYSIRAIACYLKDSSNADIVYLHKEDESIFFDLRTELPDVVFGDICQIALLSNYELHQENNRLVIRVR